MTSPDPNNALWAICLCADWCNVCRDWQGVQHEVALAHPAVVWRWIDIEDDADLLDSLDIDVETFPTLMLARRDQVLFFGPILPQADLLARLVSSHGTEIAHAPGVTPAVTALWQALQKRDL